MISFYRKYRPQIVAELDLDVVRTFFERILSSGQVSHAYLFTGPKGAGKTSAARILAKIVNCKRNQEKKLHEPCNQCDKCVSITNGTNVDVIEIDAASNRGIDDIRDLREKIRLSPVAASKKVYIIDEVHMLTMEAFNALLKTLEEPPSHALFVLATTELQKVPATIVSRCIRLHFPNASDAEVARSLTKVAVGEKLQVEEGVFEAIAHTADGSFREAIKVLEQLTLGEGKITLERTQNELGQRGDLAPGGFLQSVLARDADKAFLELKRLEQQGVNWQVFVRGALEELRHDLSKPEVREIAQRLMQAAREMKEAPIVQLPLEILVAEFCSLGEQNSSKQQVVSSQQKKEEKPPEIAGKVEEVVQRWKEVLVAVRPHNHSLEGLLRSTKPVGVVGGKLRIEVFYQFHLDQLKQEKYLRIVEEAIEGIFASSMRLEYVLGNKQPRRIPAPVENISGDVVDDDIVKVAEEIFGKE